MLVDGPQAGLTRLVTRALEPSSGGDGGGRDDDGGDGGRNYN